MRVPCRLRLPLQAEGDEHRFRGSCDVILSILDSAFGRAGRAGRLCYRGPRSRSQELDWLQMGRSPELRFQKVLASTALPPSTLSRLALSLPVLQGRRWENQRMALPSGGRFHAHRLPLWTDLSHSTRVAVTADSLSAPESLFPVPCHSGRGGFRPIWQPRSPRCDAERRGKFGLKKNS